MGWSQGPGLNPRWDNSTLCCWLREPHVKVSLGECVGSIGCSSQSAELFPRYPRLDLIISVWVGRLQGPYGGGRRGGQSLHPPLAGFLIGVLFWSGILCWSQVLGESLFSVPLSYLFVLSTVCFLLPDLMCVPLGGCANIRLCLICESDSRDHISGRASYAQGPSSAGAKLEGVGT